MTRQARIVKAGAIEPLVALLRSGSTGAKQAAAATLLLILTPTLDPNPNPNPKSNPNSVLTWTLTGKTGAGAGKLTKTRELLQVRHLVITP